MKSISFNGEIGSVTSKRDDSMGVRIVTPELNIDEKAAIMNLQGINVDIYIKPLDANPSAVVKVDKDLHTQTRSQRLRSVLYVLWEQKGKPDIFDTYYYKWMDKIIDDAKNELED